MCVVSNSQLTTKQIMEKLSVSASVSRVRRVLLSCKNIKRIKLKKKPLLTTKHKVERLRFGEHEAGAGSQGVGPRPGKSR